MYLLLVLLEIFVLYAVDWLSSDGVVLRGNPQACPHRWLHHAPPTLHYIIPVTIVSDMIGGKRAHTADSTQSNPPYSTYSIPYSTPPLTPPYSTNKRAHTADSTYSIRHLLHTLHHISYRTIPYHAITLAYSMYSTP